MRQIMANVCDVGNLFLRLGSVFGYWSWEVLMEITRSDFESDSGVKYVSNVHA